MTDNQYNSITGYLLAVVCFLILCVIMLVICSWRLKGIDKSLDHVEKQNAVCVSGASSVTAWFDKNGILHTGKPTLTGCKP